MLSSFLMCLVVIFCHFVIVLVLGGVVVIAAMVCCSVVLALLAFAGAEKMSPRCPEFTISACAFVLGWGGSVFVFSFQPLLFLL